MDNLNLKIEYIDVDKLNVYEDNAKTHTDYDVSQIKKSIEKCGFADPVGIWSDKNIIVEGHGRIMAAKELGIKQVPCVRLDYMTDEQRKKYAILHNKTAELSEWDNFILGKNLEELDFSEFDIDFGLDDEETAEKGKSKNNYPKMELKSFEHYDYLVFVFRNQHDFLRCANEFGIKKVDAGYTTRKLGIGRVVEGAELVKRLGYQDSDFESFEI